MHFSLTDGNVYRLHADKFHKPGHDRIMKLFTFFFFFWPTILGTSGSTFLFFKKKEIKKKFMVFMQLERIFFTFKLWSIGLKWRALK